MFQPCRVRSGFLALALPAACQWRGRRCPARDAVGVGRRQRHGLVSWSGGEASGDFFFETILDTMGINDDLGENGRPKMEDLIGKRWETDERQN